MHSFMHVIHLIFTKKPTEDKAIGATLETRTWVLGEGKVTCPRSRGASIWNASQMSLGPKSSLLPYCMPCGTWQDWPSGCPQSSAGPWPLGPPSVAEQGLARSEPSLPAPTRSPLPRDPTVAFGGTWLCLVPLSARLGSGR